MNYISVMGIDIVWYWILKKILIYFSTTVKVFVNNTNLTFLSFLYKISIKVS